MIYANGADVATSFITNMEDGDVIAMTSTELYELVKTADRLNRRKDAVTLPKYKYPDNVLTAAMLGYICHHGVNFSVRRRDCYEGIVGALDSQRIKKKGIFGGGLLLAEKAAAEKAAAEKAAAIEWPLSERELEIIRNIGK